MVRALDLSLTDLGSVSSSPVESSVNYLICRFLFPNWEDDNTSFITLVVYSLQKHLRAGTALQRWSVCRNPTLLKELLRDHDNSNNNLFPAI